MPASPAMTPEQRDVERIVRILDDRDGIGIPKVELARRMGAEFAAVRAEATREAIEALREPTEEMLNAARDWSYACYGKPIGNEAARGCWCAMLRALAAAPAAREEGK